MDDDPGGVDDPDERGAHRGAQPRLGADFNFGDRLVDGDRGDVAGGETVPEPRRFRAQRVEQRLAPVAGFERAHRLALAQLLDGRNDAQVRHAILFVRRFS